MDRYESQYVGGLRHCTDRSDQDGRVCNALMAEDSGSLDEVRVRVPRLGDLR